VADSEKRSSLPGFGDNNFISFLQILISMGVDDLVPTLYNFF